MLVQFVLKWDPTLGLTLGTTSVILNLFMILKTLLRKWLEDVSDCGKVIEQFFFCPNKSACFVFIDSNLKFLGLTCESYVGVSLPNSTNGVWQPITPLKRCLGTLVEIN